MLTLLDVDSTWSPAGELRRWQVEKIRALGQRDDLRYVLVQSGARTYSEAIGTNVVVEHVAVPSAPGLGERRALLHPGQLMELIQLHRPSAIGCGSADLLPLSIRLASLRLDPRPALIGYWQGEAGAELVQQLGQLHPRLEGVGERAVRWWVRRVFGSLDAIFVGDLAAAQRLQRLGLERLYLTPRADAVADGALGFARELGCLREVVERVRRGERVPAGLHVRDVADS